ncbi:zinc finger CCCH domain-containing protein 7B-like isoform 1-T2 [Pholidichthys leucotaenia]
MDPDRLKRKQEIRKALAFIQSSLAYPDPEDYQDFLTRLVCNLLEEGNALFRDGQWQEAITEFTEGLNVSCYAKAEDLQIPEALLESLYVNRAAAYHSMREYDKVMQDCDSALEVCKESRRALYRKALCLKDLCKYKEAYSCTADCLLITPQTEREPELDSAQRGQDETEERSQGEESVQAEGPGEDKQVNELAQQLAMHLGLRIRKPYVSAKVSGDPVGNDLDPSVPAAPVRVPCTPQSSIPTSSQPASSELPQTVDTLDDAELMGDDIDSLLDGFQTEQGLNEPHGQMVISVPTNGLPCIHKLPSVLPAPTPQLPPAFFSPSVNQLNSLDSFSSGGHISAATLDILDDLLGPDIGGGAVPSSLASNPTALGDLDGLDSLDCLDDVSDMAPSSFAAQDVAEPQTELDLKDTSLDKLDELNPLDTVSVESRQSGDAPTMSTKAMNQLDSLDALDAFPSAECLNLASPATSVVGTGLDSLSDFSSTVLHSAAATVIQASKFYTKDNYRSAAASNPLSSTHEFLQACSTCYPREGKGIYSFVHKPDLVHNCKRGILLCRRKTEPPSQWTRVRTIPDYKSFTGPFVLCKEVLKSGELGLCKYGERCTFAYNQLEIDVWTEERKGTLDRNLLFDMPAVKLDPVNSIIRLLQDNRGMFIFLCQECYDSKPRIISKRSKGNETICSNLDARHNFDAHKCLAFVMRTLIVNYRKVRPLSILCHLDMCRQVIRYGCPREDDCHYAHSAIELKTWKVQQDTGISPEEIVKISMKYHDKQEQCSVKQKGNRSFPGGGGNKLKGGGAAAAKSPDMRMKFVCSLCWRDGRISEPDKNLKYCSAKARHAWTKDRRVLLVKSSEGNKWVQVRPLPHVKNFPLHYELCLQILEKRRCTYTGNCTFAHSQEEKEMWTYMKNNELVDMQQMYDMWLTLSGPKHQVDGEMLSQPATEEKFITMPTDYAELMNGLFCRLCGRHSNSERQWQRHISSEKHKDRVFSCEGEDEALTWSYRFPGARFEMCPKLDRGCPDGVSCDFAHSPEELQEWIERRVFLRQKLAKAREDMLIMPDEFDFGKYNFLLQD